MKEARYFYAPDAQVSNELPAEEAAHALRVLRLAVGDELFLIDGKGSFYRAEVTMAAGKHCHYTIIEQLPQQKYWRGHLHLVIAPTKDIGRIEWMVEKATEIGFDEISFVNSRFCERKSLRTDRIEKIVVAAMKQSRKAWKPIVNPLASFEEIMSRNISGSRFICHCYEEVERSDLFNTIQQPESPEDITVMIGPEGDFSIDEVKRATSNGYLSASLGVARLRTETAGLSAMMMMQMARRL